MSILDLSVPYLTVPTKLWAKWRTASRIEMKNEMMMVRICSRKFKMSCKIFMIASIHLFYQHVYALANASTACLSAARVMGPT